MNMLINCAKARWYAFNVKVDLLRADVWEQAEHDAKVRKEAARKRALDNLAKSAEYVMEAALEVAGVEF